MLIKWKKINCKFLPLHLLYYTFTLLILNGCEQDLKEGCLDYRYVNFSVGADINCLDCCKLPELRILIRHRISQPDSIYSVNYLKKKHKEKKRNRKITNRNKKAWLSVNGETP